MAVGVAPAENVDVSDGRAAESVVALAVMEESGTAVDSEDASEKVTLEDAAAPVAAGLVTAPDAVAEAAPDTDDAAWRARRWRASSWPRARTKGTAARAIVLKAFIV